MVRSTLDSKIALRRCYMVSNPAIESSAASSFSSLHCPLHCSLHCPLHCPSHPPPHRLPHRLPSTRSIHHPYLVCVHMIHAPYAREKSFIIKQRFAGCHSSFSNAFERFPPKRFPKFPAIVHSSFWKVFSFRAFFSSGSNQFPK